MFLERAWSLSWLVCRTYCEYSFLTLTLNLR